MHSWEGSTPPPYCSTTDGGMDGWGTSEKGLLINHSGMDTITFWEDIVLPLGCNKPHRRAQAKKQGDACINSLKKTHDISSIFGFSKTAFFAFEWDGRIRPPIGRFIIQNLVFGDPRKTTSYKNQLSKQSTQIVK